MNPPLGPTLISLLRGIAPKSDSIHEASKVRWESDEWQRVVLVFSVKKRNADEVVAGFTEALRALLVGREMTSAPGTGRFIAGLPGDEQEVLVLADGYRHLRDRPPKTAIIEVLYRSVR